MYYVLINKWLVILEKKVSNIKTMDAKVLKNIKSVRIFQIKQY